MRGDDRQQGTMFSYLSPEQRVPADHPLRPIRQMVDEVLKGLSPRFDRMYAQMGRPSIAPEKLLRAFLLQILYSVRSERLLEGEVAQAFFEAVLGQIRRRGGVSEEHCSVYGTLLEAWASQKSFQNKDGGGAAVCGDDPGNPTVDFHGEKRSNQTHASRTDPEALLAKKGKGKEAKLCYAGQVLIENRHGFVVSPPGSFCRKTHSRSGPFYGGKVSEARRRGSQRRECAAPGSDSTSRTSSACRAIPGLAKICLRCHTECVADLATRQEQRGPLSRIPQSEERTKGRLLTGACDWSYSCAN